MQLGQRRCTVPVDTIFQHHRMQRPSSAQVVCTFARNARVRRALEEWQLLESTGRYCRSERGSKNGAPVGAPRRVVPACRLSIGPNMITDKLPTYNKTIQYSYRHLPVPWGSRPAYINHSSKSPAPSVIVLHARTLR
jgi:hypothetical protein